MDIDEEVRRQLDAVVGDRFDPPRAWRATLLKWLGAALLAVATAATIAGILDSNLTNAEKNAEKAPKRPVTVRIVPGR
jgi:hypothetical protein